MNILFALSQIEVTGAEVFAVTLADKLIEKGHSVFIVSDTLTKKTKAEYHSLRLANRKLPNRMKNVIALNKFIYSKKIDIVVANSRAAAWISTISCKMCNIPLITIIHGRQATFLSRKVFRGFGSYTFTVCEKLQDQILNFFKIPPYRVEILRNPFDLSVIKPVNNENEIKIITLIGRLSGPKGELAYKLLDFYSSYLNKGIYAKFKVVGGKTIPPEFEKFKNSFEFTGFVEDISSIIDESDLVIGSGRIAIESILRNKPTVAVGEACSIGLITRKNIDFALATNFGDMNEKEREFDFNLIMEDMKRAFSMKECDAEVVNKVRNEFDLVKIADRMESVFQSVITYFHKIEIPIIYYHRVIKDESEAGKHGIYVTQKLFDEHLKYLKNNNYKTITFDEALELKKNNIQGKNVIITFDDGYEDNYLYAFPLLKKYDFNAEIFLVAGLAHNEWDRKDNEPVAPMLKKEQILEMKNYGIRFGSHTLTHRDLTKCESEERKNEIYNSRKLLEEKLGFNIESIAYPYGNYSEEIISEIKDAGYKYGYATDRGPLGLHEDIFKVRRITIFPNTSKFHFARKIKGNYVFKKIKEEKDFFNFSTKIMRSN